MIGSGILPRTGGLPRISSPALLGKVPRSRLPANWTSVIGQCGCPKDIHVATAFAQGMPRFRAESPCFFTPGMYPNGVKRPFVYRVVTALWSIWFAAALVGPATLHACPEHASLTHASHAAPSHHDGHAAVAAGDSQAPTRTADADCNCLGECCAVSAIEATKQQAGRADSFVAKSSVATIRDVEAPAAAHYYDQPFANGPPSAFATA